MLPICPAVLEHEDAESLFKALQDKHPVDLFRHLTATKIISYFMHLMYISMHGHVLVGSSKTL